MHGKNSHVWLWHCLSPVPKRSIAINCLLLKGHALGDSVKSTIPVPREKCGCTLMWILCHSLFKYIENHSLLSNYYGKKYIDKYSNAASGIPAYGPIFVMFIKYMGGHCPLFSLGIIIANPSLSGIWLSLLYLSAAFWSILEVLVDTVAWMTALQIYWSQEIQASSLWPQTALITMKACSMKMQQLLLTVYHAPMSQYIFPFVPHHSQGTHRPSGNIMLCRLMHSNNGIIPKMPGEI